MNSEAFGARWDGFATLPDSEIDDRRAYERQCLAFLERFPPPDEARPHLDFELTDARLVGVYPGTRIEVEFRITGVAEPIRESWPIWTGEGQPIKDGNGIPHRWTPSDLIRQHLTLYYEL